MVLNNKTTTNNINVLITTNDEKEDTRGEDSHECLSPNYYCEESGLKPKNTNKLQESAFPAHVCLGKRKSSHNDDSDLIAYLSNKKRTIQRSMICDIIPLNIFFKTLLRKRGYSMRTYPVLETAYFNKPTKYQQSCYGVKVTQAARTGDVQTIRKLLKCGLSTNPCNKFGESLIHIVCRRGNTRNSYAMLKELINLGSSIQLCDDFGRTPLHDACWTVDPCFHTLSLLLDVDVNLLNMKDSRGSTPLDYVDKDNQRKFIEFLLLKKDVYFPVRDESDVEPIPELTILNPHSKMILDPKKSMSHDLAKLLAAGLIEPEKVMMMYPEERKTFKDKINRPPKRPLIRFSNDLKE